MLTDKSKEDHLRLWTLKRSLVIFAEKVWLIWTLVSLWLLVNSFKESSKEKRLIDFFDYFIQRYFDYFIIILQDILIILLLFCLFLV